MAERASAVLVVLARAFVAPIFLAGLGVVSGAAPQVHAQWPEPAQRGWTSLSVYHQSATEQFSPTGDRVAYPLNGRARAAQAFLTTDVGLGRGFDVWVQLAFQTLEFRDLTAVRRSTGLGDLRLYGRWSPSERLGWSLPVALRAGVKIPVGDFDAFSSILPLGDGQTDFEVVGEVGHSFWPLDAYVTAWLGYRWRRPQSVTGFDLGNEPFFFLSGARSWGRVGLRLGVEGTLGEEPERLGLSRASQARRLVRVSPSFTAALGPGSLEAGVRWPIMGRNLPSAPDLVIGYFFRWGADEP